MSIWKRSKGAYVVRVEPYRAQTVVTREDAEKLERDLKRRRSMGELYEAPPNELGAELDAWLERIFATRKLAPRTVEWYLRSRKAWRDLDRVRVRDLTRRLIEDRTAARAAVAPKSAADELMILKQCLTDAASRGQRVDRSILDIPAVEHRPRRGRALTLRQLYWFASWFPEHARRLVLIAGQVGARQNFWFNMTDDMLDLEAGTMLAPAELQKNGRDHLVHLTGVEVALFREQLVARSPGTRLVFPSPHGKRWARQHFRNRVWVEGVEAAARNDMLESGLPTSVFGRFDREEKLVDAFTFHLLRHTAGSLMAWAGFEPPVAAERLGHTDGGALYLKTYRHLYDGERRRNADKLDAMVRTELAAMEADEAQGEATA